MFLKLLQAPISTSSPEVKFCCIKLLQRCHPGQDVELADAEVIKDELRLLSEEVIKPLALIAHEEIQPSVELESPESDQDSGELAHDESSESLTGVKKLAHDLGVSDLVLKQTFDYLKLTGLIHQEQEFIATRAGRIPNTYYWVESKLREFMSPYQVPDGRHVHRALIENLLKPDHGKKGGANKPGHPLKLANRLLLMVLLSKADDCGVVRNMGMADLGRQTCLSRDRLESQLTKLKKKGISEAMCLD